MTRRYFAAHLPAQGGVVTLDEAESHHAIKVMRAKTGESITLFDGLGNECAATIETLGRREIICKTSAASAVHRENGVALTLGVAMPKGDRSKELVERLTELGVNRLVPLHCKRTQWPVPDNAIQKWQRVVIDACKQSERNHLMEISPPHNLASWLATVNSSPAVSRFMVHPDDSTANPESSLASATEVIAMTEVHAVIGPEGGFSDDEVSLADTHGWKRLSLGNRIYRIETAAILATIKLAGL